MRLFAWFLVPCSLSLISAAAPVVAQTPDEFTEPRDITGGIMIGAYLGVVPGFSVKGKGGAGGLAADLGTAPSFGLQVGYTVLPWLAAFLNVDRSDHDSLSPLGEDGYSLHHVELAARFLYHVRRIERIVVHGNVGLGMRQIYNKRARIEDASGRLILTAPELNAGGGVHYFVTTHIALDGNVQFGFGSFSRATIPGQPRRSIRTENVVSTRLRAGIAWYPFDY